METDTEIPADLIGYDEKTIRAVAARLRAIGSGWSARIIEIDAGLGRFDPGDDDHGRRIETLRAYADLLEAHPNIKPGFVMSDEIWHNVYASDPAEVIRTMREIRRVFGGTFTKEWDGDEHYNPEFRMRGKFGSMGVKIYASRGDVCEKVVVGQTTEVVTIKDPDLVQAATADIPTVEREIKKDITQWICPEELA